MPHFFPLAVAALFVLSLFAGTVSAADDTDAVEGSADQARLFVSLRYFSSSSCTGNPIRTDTRDRELEDSRPAPWGAPQSGLPETPPPLPSHSHPLLPSLLRSGPLPALA
jgi:hypothetical protein